MPATKAAIGYGTTLEIADAAAPTVWQYIAETYAHTPPNFTDSEVDVSHMQSPNRSKEYIAGLSDTGESSHEMNFVPGSATDLFLLGIKGKNLIARLTFTNGRQLIYRCVRTGYERDIPLEDRMSATLTLKVSGDPALTAIAAPRNLVAPVIDGASTAREGIPLIVDPGVWAGAETIEFQWLTGASDLVDENGATYVPVSDDVGNLLAVEVTGSNSLFDTTVTSAATAAVLAAA